MYIVMMTKWRLETEYLYSTIIDRLEYDVTPDEYIRECIENGERPYPWEPICIDEDAEIIVYDPENHRNGYTAWISDYETEGKR